MVHSSDTVLRPKAYSYVRFSTPEQAKGTSKARQTDGAAAYAQKHGLELVETFHDLGESAYRGGNAETGRLGDFLDLVKGGFVEQGSYLIVESLDRISRQTPRKALRTLEDIIDGGVIVVTLFDGKAYDRKSLEGMDLLVALLLMVRANEESATKARRLKEAWSKNRAKAVSEGRVLTKIVPGWVRMTPERTLEAIPERAAIVQRIYSMFLDGTGRESIARTLNSEGVETWGVGGKRLGRHWHSSYISKVLDNPAVIGTLVTRTVETENGKEVIREAAQIEGYYPPVVDKETFARVRSIRDTTGASPKQKGKAPARNLVAGLACCPVCGGAMIRVTKGSSSKAGKPYLVCAKAKMGAGCTYRAVGLEEIDFAVRGSYRELSKVLLSEGSEGLAREIDQLETNESETKDEIVRITNAIAKNGTSPALQARLRQSENWLDQISAELKAKRVVMLNQTHALRRARVTELQTLLQSPDVAKVNLGLRELLRSITVNYQTGELACFTKAGARLDLTFRMPASD